MIGLKRREEEIDILQKRLFRINYFRDIKYEISFKKLKDPLSIEIPIRFKSSEEYMRYFESYLYKKILWEIGRRIEEEMINEARRVIIVDGKLEKSGYLYLCIKIAVENEEREDVLAKKEEGDVDVDKDKDKEIDINTMNSINRDKDINKAVRTMDMHKDDLIILTKGEDPIAKDVHFVGIVEDNIDNINDIKVKTEISGKDHSGVLNALFKNSEWKVYKLFNMREYMEAFKSIRNIENSPLVNYIVNIVEMERDIPPIYYTVPSPSASHNTYQGCLRKVGVSLFDIENDEWEGGWGEQIVLLVDQLLTISTFANPKQPKVWSLDELMHDSDDDGYQDGYIYNIQNKRKICPWLFGDDAHMDNYPHLESLLSHPSPKYFKAIHTDFSLTLTKEKYEEKPPQNILICSSDTFQLDNLLLCFHQYHENNPEGRNNLLRLGGNIDQRVQYYSIKNRLDAKKFKGKGGQDNIIKAEIIKNSKLIFTPIEILSARIFYDFPKVYDTIILLDSDKDETFSLRVLQLGAKRLIICGSQRDSHDHSLFQRLAKSISP